MKKIFIIIIILLVVGLGIWSATIIMDNMSFETDPTCFTVEDNKITAYNEVCDVKVKIPSTINGVEIKEIDNYAFKDLDLTDVIIEEGIEVIGFSAFEGNLITRLELPSSLKNIKAYAFNDNKIENLDLPYIETIGVMAFNNNELKESDAYIYLPRNGEYDKEVLIGYGGKDKDIKIPDSVTTLYLNALEGNELTNVDLNKVERLEKNSLADNLLTTITIPSSVNYVGEDSLSDNELTDIIILGKTSIEEFNIFDMNLEEIVKFQ